MSIHNIVDVKESESHDSGATRDRFGKNHLLQNEDGSSRIQRSRRKFKIFVWAALLSQFFCGQARSVESETPSVRRNTNITIEGTDFDDLFLDQKIITPQDKFAIPVDESTAIGINEDGDPNLNMRF